MGGETSSEKKPRQWSPPPEVRVLLTLRDISAIYGRSGHWVDTAMRKEGFPLPIACGRRSKSWWRHEVENWFANQPRGYTPLADKPQFQTEAYLSRFEQPQPGAV